MNTNPTNEVPAGEVQRRDHVILPRRDHVYRVDHTHRYAGPGGDTVMLVITQIGLTAPQVERRLVDDLIQVATDEQVAEARDAALRAEVVAGLKKLAGLIEEHKPRLKIWPGLGLDMPLADGEVSRIAAALGVELRDGFGSSKSKRAPWSPTVSDLGETLTVYFEGVPAPEPVVIEPAVGAALAGKVQVEVDALPAEQPEGLDSMSDQAAGMAAADEAGETPEADQPWHFTFGSGLLYDGRYVVITGTHESARARMFEVFGRAWCDQYSRWEFTSNAALDGLIELPESEWPPVVADDEPAGEQEHSHVGGSAGGPGQNDVECACGATYGGFDTHAEAMELLNQHIADEAATPTQQAGE